MSEASLPSAFIDALQFTDHSTEAIINKNNSTGHNNTDLKETSCPRTDSTDNSTKNIIAILLYTLPMGIVMATSDNKNTKSFLPGDRPILFSKAFLEKL